MPLFQFLNNNNPKYKYRLSKFLINTMSMSSLHMAYGAIMNQTQYNLCFMMCHVLFITMFFNNHYFCVSVSLKCAFK